MDLYFYFRSPEVTHQINQTTLVTLKEHKEWIHFELPAQTLQFGGAISRELKKRHKHDTKNGG